MYVRKKKEEDVSYYGDASDHEDEAEEDEEEDEKEKGRSPFYFGEPNDEERDKGSSSKRNKDNQSVLAK